MASWGNLLCELRERRDVSGNILPALNHDQLREKYLALLHKKTGRAIIAYYSGWLAGKGGVDYGIDDSDLTGFMQCLCGVDCSKGLDLILHTPGGRPTAAEGIVNYIHEKFDDDIRVIVPQMAMSAGTMLACASKEILMGKQSCLGPIDPQYSGVSAYNILNEFQHAKLDLQSNPKSESYWKIQLNRYPWAFFYAVSDGVELSSVLVAEWLAKYMFKGDAAANIQGKISSIVSRLNDNNKSHARHFGVSVCEDLGLKIKRIEEDNELQDCILSVHHAFTITFDQTPIKKIVENHLGERFLVNR